MPDASGFIEPLLQPVLKLFLMEEQHQQHHPGRKPEPEMIKLIDADGVCVGRRKLDSSGGNYAAVFRLFQATPARVGSKMSVLFMPLNPPTANGITLCWSGFHLTIALCRDDSIKKSVHFSLSQQDE